MEKISNNKCTVGQKTCKHHILSQEKSYCLSHHSEASQCQLTQQIAAVQKEELCKVSAIQNGIQEANIAGFSIQ
jgi:hypothetical protein